MKKICISNLMRHCEEASPTRQSKLRTLDCFAKARNDGRKKGFTLVELSIVLVIIGLLIGGILVGQSLIETAKVNRIVSNLYQYEIAVKLFEDKFKQIPGDSSFFAPAGNNDGDINDDNGCDGDFSGKEDVQFFAHLSQASMLSKIFPIWSPSSCGSGTDNINPKAWVNATESRPFTEVSCFNDVYQPDNLKKQVITPVIADNRNIGFEIYVDPLQQMSIISKMSEYNDNDSNGIGIDDGACYTDTGMGDTGCTDANACGGYVGYFFKPN